MAGKIGRNIPDHIYRALLARSGNKCAFTGCKNVLIDTKNNYVAQLCHIESVSHKKQRYNPALSEEEVNGYNNLMFMCLKHHVETNDEKNYTTVIMREMKYEHESKYVENPFQIDMSHIFALKKETEEYWIKVETVLADEHVFPELKIDVDISAEYNILSDQILVSIQQLENLIELIDDEQKEKYWDIYNIGFPNHLNKIKVLIEHMEIKYLESYTSENPNDLNMKYRLDHIRKNFLETTKKSLIID